MEIKEFLRPDIQRISIFILIFVILFLFGFVRFWSFSYPTPLEYIIGLAILPAVIFAGIIGGGGTYFSLLISLILYSYILACIIISIYNKDKRLLVILLALSLFTLLIYAYSTVWIDRLIATPMHNQSYQTIVQMGQQIRIDNVKSGSIMLRNSGTQTIPAGLVTVVGLSTNCTNIFNLTPGSTFNCTGTCTPGATITVSAPGNADSAACVS